MPALSCTLAQRARGDPERSGGGLDFCDKVVSGGHVPKTNVIFHTWQAETSHSGICPDADKTPGMEESEVFRANLLAAMRDAGLKAAELSKMAGLNARAVKDIEERRTVSPKLSTVFALCRALNRDPAEMMGLGPRHRMNKRLADFLSQYEEADQARFLSALELLTPPR